MSPAESATGTGTAGTGRGRGTGPADLARRVLLALSFALLLAVGLFGPSAAKPPLGPRGWAPGELPWAPSSALVTALLWTAYLLGAAGVALALLRPTGRAWSWRGPLLLAAAALLTGPFGSADHTNYAAYGRIAAQGGDPYLVPPEDWAGGLDPVTSAVEPPWTETVSVYGPFATLLHLVSSLVGGDSMRQTVWVWQLITVLAWLAVRWVLLRTAIDHAPRRRAVDRATRSSSASACSARTSTWWRPPSRWPGSSWPRETRGLPVPSPASPSSTKITYGVVGLAVILAWLQLDRDRLARRLVAYAVAALAVVVPLHLWAGPHVFDQLGRARRSVSLATPWRLMVEGLDGVMASSSVRTLIVWLSTVLFAAFVLLLWRLTAGRAPETVTGAAVRWAFVLSTAYALAAPYSLPWYDQLTWATLPVLAASALDLVLLGRLTVMALAYVPGRVVAMTPAVEDFTLGFRRLVAPYAALLVWVCLTVVWLRGSRRSPAPRPAGSRR